MLNISEFQAARARKRDVQISGIPSERPYASRHVDSLVSEGFSSLVAIQLTREAASEFKITEAHLCRDKVEQGLSDFMESLNTRMVRANKNKVQPDKDVWERILFGDKKSQAKHPLNQLDAAGKLKVSASDLTRAAWGGLCVSLGKMATVDGASVQSVAKRIGARLKNLTGGAESEVRLAYEQAALVLLDYLCAATGWFQEVTGERKFGRETQQTNSLVATPKFLSDVLSDSTLADFAEGKPMVVPPVPWTTEMNHGGFLYSSVQAVRGVRKSIEGESIVSALNALQQTAWRTNAKVWEVAERFERDALSSHIEGYGTVAVRHDVTPELRSSMIRAALTLDAIREVSEFESFWFPWNLDWRGRMYPATTILSPQGSDLCKGLLEFSEGVPLGRDGARWLAIHLCNLMGEDKLWIEGRKVNRTAQERELWTHDNHALILAIANDPYTRREWLKADKPYQFLAACFEWAGYQSEGVLFRSRLAGALDGSCSGVQMLSGMTRDRSAGGMVNLTPTERGDDYYGRMAEALTARLVGLVSEATPEVMEHLKFWSAQRLDRDLLKSPGMTKVYSAGVYTFAEQVQAKTAASTAECLWLAAQINACFSRVAPGMLGAMKYLQDVADVLTEKGVALQWTTPAGLVVRQERFNEESTALRTHAFGMKRDRTFKTRKDTLSKRAQRAGVSPNFVHGVDAAHMVRTINALYNQGVRNFHMIHDSFGAPFAQCDAVFRTTREEFVTLMEGDILANWTIEVTAELPPKAKGKLPELPEFGDLILSDVLESNFAWF